LLVVTTVACGYDGCVMLHGVLGEEAAAVDWEPKAVYYGCPVYFGMLTAAYVRRPLDAAL
jgi:aromatic ring-opening dioxygenase LigB subunit